MTEDHKRKIAEALKRSWTPERREALRQKRMGAQNPFFGKTHTSETRERFSKKLSGELNPFHGKTHDDATRELMSSKRIGRAPKLYKYGISDEEYEAQLANGVKWCTGHKAFLPVDRFYSVRKGDRQIKGGHCQECSRGLQLKKKFGLTNEQYETMFAAQKGVCALCESPQTKRRRLCVDHNHQTGAIRGLLCNMCNSGLERVEAVPNWAAKAMQYLQHYI